MQISKIKMQKLVLSDSRMDCGSPSAKGGRADSSNIKEFVDSFVIRNS